MAEKIALINLGCPKNLVDAEVMLGHLKARGYELTADPDAADVVVVNTCGFLQDAAQESVDTLLEVAERKESGQLKAVIAAGCMTQRFGPDVADAMPEVDGFLGVGQAHALPDVVQRVLSGERAAVLSGPSAGFEGYGLRLQAAPGASAYLKISEGCDRKCAFCIIPQIRGEMVSRPIDTLVREAELLAAQGVRELILIGQDPTRYGVDLPGERSAHLLPQLLQRLNAVEALRWVRVMYLFPDRHAVPVLETIPRLERVCQYVGMPLQHVAPNVLRKMNRPGGAEEYHRLLENFRAASPDASVRSTFIVGFPGETEADFQMLLDFVEKAELDWVGGFRYSREEGSPAGIMEGQVSKREKQARYEALMVAAQAATRKRLQRWVGRRLEVLVETVHEPGRLATGRTQGQAPEIDGETRIELSALPETRPGDFVLVEVTATGDYDLEGRALKLQHRPPRQHPELVRIGLAA